MSGDVEQEGLFPSPQPAARSDALLSEDGAYRYWLHREWGYPGPGATFVMLNPSTADAVEDDRTIGRCIDFAKSWGCVRLRVVNLYALRSTNPDRLWTVDDPVGPENDEWIGRALDLTSGPVVAAWGVNARQDRVDHVLALPGMGRAQCLGHTKDGHPRHPLYVRGDTPLRPFAAR